MQVGYMKSVNREFVICDKPLCNADWSRAVDFIWGGEVDYSEIPGMLNFWIQGVIWIELPQRKQQHIQRPWMQPQQLARTVHSRANTSNCSLASRLRWIISLEDLLRLQDEDFNCNYVINSWTIELFYLMHGTRLASEHLRKYSTLTSSNQIS